MLPLNENISISQFANDRQLKISPFRATKSHMQMQPIVKTYEISFQSSNHIYLREAAFEFA